MTEAVSLASSQEPRQLRPKRASLRHPYHQSPIKAKVQTSRTKQMLFVFIDNKGLVYTHIVPKATTINANYILVALGKLMIHLRKKRPEMTTGQWFFHWDNAPVHTAAIVEKWLAVKKIQLLSHLPYSPELTPADFFLL